MRLGADLEGVAFDSKLRLDIHKRLVQRARAASAHLPNGRGTRCLGVWDGRASDTDLQGPRHRSRFLEAAAH